MLRKLIEKEKRGNGSSVHDQTNCVLYGVVVIVVQWHSDGSDGVVMIMIGQ